MTGKLPESLRMVENWVKRAAGRKSRRVSPWGTKPMIDSDAARKAWNLGRTKPR